MYQNELKELIDQEMWNACMAEIERRKELRHRRVMERQISKFNRPLVEKNCEYQGGHSNHQSGCSNQHCPEMNNNTSKRWVINLSSIPLTQEQECLLAHGSNFVVTPPKWGLPQMGNSPCPQPKQFADEIRKIKLEEGECITSYDVTALFTSIPVASALKIIRSKLEQDADLPNRTSMTADNIIELLGSA